MKYVSNAMNFVKNANYSYFCDDIYVYCIIYMGRI